MSKLSSFLSREQVDRADAVNEQQEQTIVTAQNTDPANDPATSPTEPTSSEDADPGPEPVVLPVIAQADFDRVSQERDQLLDRLARLQAEFDNARKREARERAEFRDFATAAAIEPLLPSLDHFNLALKAKGTPEQFRQGVELIARQLEEALKGLGVVPVESVGAQFNPHLHEALGSVETSDVPDHEVVEELRRGYKFKERLLRPAQVRVANNPNLKEA